MLDLVIWHLNNPGNAATLTTKGLDVAATNLIPFAAVCGATRLSEPPLNLH